MLLRKYIGETLLKERTKQGRTLRDVSAQATVSLGYLSELERGLKEASSEVINSICEALVISPIDLLIDVTVSMSQDLGRELDNELDSINHKEPINI
jgi:transcriptional regulator with XRE-family HTH domain